MRSPRCSRRMGASMKRGCIGLWAAICWCWGWGWSGGRRRRRSGLRVRTLPRQKMLVALASAAAAVAVARPRRIVTFCGLEWIWVWTRKGTSRWSQWSQQSRRHLPPLSCSRYCCCLQHRRRHHHTQHPSLVLDPLDVRPRTGSCPIDQSHRESARGADQCCSSSWASGGCWSCEEAAAGWTMGPRSSLHGGPLRTWHRAAWRRAGRRHWS